MASKAKNTIIKKLEVPKTRAIISSDVGDYGKHPFFLKKAEAAKATLDRVGLPKEVADRIKKS